MHGNSLARRNIAFSDASLRAEIEGQYLESLKPEMRIRYNRDPDTPLEGILAAANAAQFEIDRTVHASDSDHAEFDLNSLMEATGLNRSIAILVLKLNGARADGSKWTDAPRSEPTVCVVFPCDLMHGY